jgi:sulfite exporter TauE/SafE
MLTSIHPLGERARGNRWWMTAAAFTAGSVITAAGIGAVLGGAGRWLLPTTVLGSAVTIGAVVFVTALLDLAGVAAPGPQRQVNERWIGTFRGWVYGAAFGAQLGSGLATFVVTWLVYATLAAELLAGSALAGAAVGVAFGVGRSLPVIAARWIDRPSRLVSVSSTMAQLAHPMFRGLAITAAALGAAAIMTGTV